MTKKTCKKCGYEWTPRVDSPRACPKCKSYEWEKERVIILSGLNTVYARLTPSHPPGEAETGSSK